MGELLKCVAVEARTDEWKSQLRKVGSAFLVRSEVHKKLCIAIALSRSVVFVDNNPKTRDELC